MIKPSHNRPPVHGMMKRPSPKSKSHTLLAFCFWCIQLLCLVERCKGQAPTNATTDPSEVRALNAIFQHWGRSASNEWNRSGEPCNGIAVNSSTISNPGIICDCSFNGGSTCHITQIKLQGLNVIGPIPEELQNLTFLTNLDFSQNYITGPLPAFIGNLRSMRYFSVSINALSGSIPKELGNLRNVISLGISSNNFSGSLPPELGNLTSMQELYMDSSGLSGEIPSTFASLRNMQILWASDNQLTGRIPDFIGSWNLTKLSMQGNAFEGPIPSSFSNLISLTDLRLSDVSNGSSSLSFIENMTSLNNLVLRNNMLSGTIPSTIGKYQLLMQMDLSFNNLSGQIPDSLFNISSLVYLFLGNNNLSGTLPSQKSNTLLNVDLSYNQLSGSFPSWVSEGGLNLSLVANNFVFDSSNSSGLPLSLNCLQRSFPCNRNPPIYSSFAIRCGGPTMKTTNTEYEGDNATLGPASYDVTSTENWAVSNVGRFSEGSNTRYFRYDQVVFSNTVDLGLFQYARLSPGSLRYYGLGLQNGNYTVNLKFAETVFPDSQSWQSTGKRIFDIYLQGKLEWKDFNIKKEAGSVNRAIEKQQQVIVSQNVLEIHLHWAGKGTCCIPFPGTYGPAISAISVTPNFQPTVRTPPTPQTSGKKNKTALAVGISVSVGVLCIVLVVVVFIWKRSKRMSTDEDEEFLGMGPRPNTFSYAELKTATEDFNPANKLGQGGFGPVFKGTLLDGRIVAVKQLSVASHQGKSQFVAEIATISAVQQRNLVKLYGCCIEGVNRLLVYEYLENKSLDQALFGKSNLHLDWNTRFEICLGTARGLAYLHEESRPRIVHRDVKASNILLDADLNPKISDFGLAKLYDDNMTHISTRVAGTIGYLAPEYAMRGHLTEKADVFGFGVVALEIVSGRPNTSQNVDPEKMYLLEWAWYLHENDRALELVDPTLSKFDEGEAARMIGIALLCIQASPTLRPPMSRVVAMLLGDIEVGTVLSKPGYLTGLPSNDTSSFMSYDTSRASTGVSTTSQQFSLSNKSGSPLGTTEPMLHEVIGNGRWCVRRSANSGFPFITSQKIADRTTARMARMFTSYSTMDASPDPTAVPLTSASPSFACNSNGPLVTPARLRLSSAPTMVPSGRTAFAFGLPVSSPAMYDSGTRSPDAVIVPRSGRIAQLRGSLGGERVGSPDAWGFVQIGIEKSAISVFGCLGEENFNLERLSFLTGQAGLVGFIEVFGQVRALNAIFQHWGRSASNEWNISGEPCNGIAVNSSTISNPGIICDCSFNGGSTCHITQIKLQGLNVIGPIPEELQNLTFLTNLDFSQNYITGPLPAFIGNLRSMRYFSVSINALSGSIPKELGNLQNVISLGISSNNFSGSLPPELGNLTSMQELYMDSSGLSGEIPSTFASLRNMQILWASDNQLTGRIPDFIGSWNLTKLSMQGNAFEGPIPSSFSNLISLTDLRLSDVSNGSSSLSFIENMTSLNNLVLRNNMLSGTIPSTIGKYQLLMQMDLSFNNLSGQIPDSLFNISSLVYLFLGNNNLSGTLPSQKSDTLLNLDLSYNQLSGSFPSWVSEGGLNLSLVANNFVFDSSNSRCLSILNCLQRSFPCNRNPPIYSSFAIRCGGPTMKTTNTEYEGDNATLGPASYDVTSTENWAVSNVGRFSEGSNTRYFRYDQVVFSNTVDLGLFQYARLSPGSLRYYGLGLQNGNYTVNLKFAETVFPDSQSWQSTGKRIFDIYLQGKLEWKDFNIKKEAGSVNRAIEKQQQVIVSQNVLEIHLHWAGKGTCCIPFPGTYGPAISAISVTPNFQPTVRTPPTPQTSGKKNKTALAVGISVSVGVLCIVLVVVVFIWKRSKRMSTDEDEEFLGMGPRPNTFSYAELKTATEDFNPANKLGQGGFGPVFKGTLLDGRIVAVKQLSVASHQGKSQFVAEIATISAVQQRNLVKLYGCCIEGVNRLLVYEYLENKSLDQALFGKSNLHLDWNTRFEICLGTARGLAYLHEESRPRIVHRDVKASNILLDADLNPKISDFGLAKLYDDNMTHISTRVAGTIGYLAPEYAMRGHLTEKADVFGFGVVALEIVSGRPNTSQNVDPEKMYLLEWAWYLHENDRALELVDPTLSNFDEGEAARMIGIALLCIQASPTLRPPMSRVVAMLLGDIEVGTVLSKPGYLTGLPSNDTSSFMSYDTSRASTGVSTTSQQFSLSNKSGSPLGTTEPMLHEVIGNGR
ncbi:uncharacterized protein LOC131219940 [Magnolia sinica]|uniref:uncharacterized protein LOC131219940 n=1 Tax=Magnolia sinica TaxID=86752 RepID=UPI0026584913|nr:uncharacterized protein LOC131219940 [Magnolia sinica]